MAASGSFNTTAYGSYGRYVNFSWSIKSQSIEDNETIISWTLKGAGGDSTTNYYNSGPFQLTINGTVVYESSTRIELRNGTVIKTGETTISHNTDGTKTFSASCKAAIYSASYNVSGSGSWALTQIPRAATVTAAPALFYDTDSPTVTYSNPAGSAVTKLEVCITNNSGGGIVGYREISKTGTSYTFTFTAAEKTALYKACSTSNSMPVRFYIRTTIGSNYYYSYLDKRFGIKDPEPILAPTAVDTLAASLALTGNKNNVILGFNKMSLAVNATPQKEATIVSYKITCLDKTLTTATGTMDNVESGIFTFTATDSRGNEGYEVLSLGTYGYFKPTCNIGTTSFNTSGTMSVAVSGKFYNNSFGATSNTLTLQYRLSENGGSWGSWTTATATKSGSNYSATITKSGLNYQSNYDIEVKVTDKISSKTATKQLQALPVFEWDKNSFNFNVPVSFEGVPMTDFIVEQGTSGNWTYRKWNSGLAECWARIAVSTAVNTAWGGLYVSGSLSATNLSFPFTFTAIPALTTTLSGSGSGAFLIASGSGSTTTSATGVFEIARGSASASTLNYAINYHALGRWK